MRRHLRDKGLAAAGALLLAAAVLHFTGFFERLDQAFADFRFAALEHTVESDIVIVGIDALSLDQLSTWPWPRRYHASLLQQLARSEPRQVFFDIDFSSAAPDSSGDDFFEAALAQWDGPPVMLAAHVQANSGSEGVPVSRRPLARFRQHAREVSVALDPDADGLVRTMPVAKIIDGSEVPSAFTVGSELANRSHIPVDYSIDPASFSFVSYSNLLNGAIDPSELAGKTVYIGAWSYELGDAVAVPRHMSLPGVLVQALAAETARTGPAIAVPPSYFVVFLAVWTALWFAVFLRGNWRRNTLLGMAGLAALILTSVLLFGTWRIQLDVVAPGFVLVAAFVIAALRSLDYQTWRALAYAVGVRRRDALLKSVVETSMDSIITLESDGTLRTANPAASSLFQLPLRRMIGMPIADIIPDFGNPADRISSSGYPGEFRAVDSAGRTLPVEATVSRIAVEDSELFTLIIRDVTERKTQQNKLEYQATHDSLTNLPNRTAVTQYLDDRLDDSTHDRRVAVLMLDLCRFKEVNDTLGHSVGDDVLRIVSTRFSEALTERAFIGRIGGDEFAVIVPEVSRRPAIELLAENLVECLKTPIQVQGVAIEVGLSIGIAFIPDHAATGAEALRHADVAMYSAKRRNSAYEFYAREDDRNSVRRLSMVSDLRKAIADSEIELLYQPQIDLQSNALISAEALLRWNHPVHGPVSPDEFVAIAESTDIIQPLTHWTIAEALKQAVQWREQGLDLRVAVNLSARSLQSVEFPAELKVLLGRFGLAPSRLELEITETAMMLDPERALAIVRDLHALGVRIAIDDFGTGYSSLGYLRDLHVDALKLDKSFVIDLENREQNRVIVESTAQMSEALGIEMVAEGIETEWVRDYLCRAGYRVGQGYWFGKPMPAEALRAQFGAPETRSIAV